MVDALAWRGQRLAVRALLVVDAAGAAVVHPGVGGRCLTRPLLALARALAHHAEPRRRRSAPRHHLRTRPRRHDREAHRRPLQARCPRLDQDEEPQLTGDFGKSEPLPKRSAGSPHSTSESGVTAESEHLTCAECGTTAEDDAPGWRAYLTGEDGEVDGVEVFCPECAREEFGDSRLEGGSAGSSATRSSLGVLQVRRDQPTSASSMSESYSNGLRSAFPVSSQRHVVHL